MERIIRDCLDQARQIGVFQKELRGNYEKSVRITPGDIIPYRLREANVAAPDSEVSGYLDPILTQL